jgi:class 3 adenylate cyclase
MQGIFNKLSIQSKLMLMMLLTSIASIVITGYIGYSSGRENLSQTVFDQLTSLRAAKAAELQGYYGLLEDTIKLVSEGPINVRNMQELRGTYRALGTVEELSSQQQQALTAYYQENVLPVLAEKFGKDPVLATYLPQTPAQQYLQYHYVVANPNPPGEKYRLDDAGDGSDYSQVHARFHQLARRIIDRLGFTDIYLVDADTGDMIYSAGKKVDFATNLKTGPYASSRLAAAFEGVVNARDPKYVENFDFEFYPPANGEAVGYVATSIFAGPTLLGAMIFQVPVEVFNRIMTANGNWEAVGLGRTGETYLVGSDFRLRTNSRFFLEDQPGYMETLKRQGKPNDDIGAITRLGTPVLLQDARTVGTERALAGQSGTDIYEDYRGIKVLGSYQPYGRQGNLAILAEMDAQEAFSPINRFTRRLLVASAILIPLVTLLSSQLARLFMRPLKQLMMGTERISAGETDVQVQVQAEDEFGELATSFNTMAQNLHLKEQALQGKIQENDRLLLNILPAPVAQRLKQGEEKITDTFSSLTVLYAELEGIHHIHPDDCVGYLNELVQVFDETADAYGVEKVKATGGIYVAVCGLSEQRIDHTKRTVDFALELLKVMRRFSQMKQVTLTLDIGIDTGPVVAGIVGKDKFIYDLLGETVNTARAIHRSPKQNVIQVSVAVYDRLRDLYTFDKLPNIERKGLGTFPVWELKGPAATAVMKAD